MIPLRRPDIFGEPRPMFATCDIGLESALVASLEAVGATNIMPVQRGVGFVGDRELCWRINLESRVASRVLVPIAEFPAPDKALLLAGATEAPWSSWFQVSKTIAVDATSEGSALDHTGYIAQVVKDGICDHFRATSGRRPDVDKKMPEVRINARLENDRCIVSLDSSGVSLDRRGYRREAGPAPLRETLAAGCLFFSGWTPDKVLVDPMCGAGTLLIEAALISTCTPPGLGRGRRGHFSFTHWYGHRQARFDAVLDELEAAIIEPEQPIFGSDVDPEVLGAAIRNAERAGVANTLTFAQLSIASARPPVGADKGVVVCNPPYGHRIGTPGELESLYANLGRTLRAEFGGWDCWLLIGEGAPGRVLGMSPDDRVHLRNGPIECQLLQYQVFEGRPSFDERRWPDDPRSARSDDRPPRGDRPRSRSGARDDRGPRPQRRSGARDDRGGPRDDRGGYQGDRGGARDDRGGYRDNRGGPRDDRGGHRDNRGGPRDDRGGYQGNRGGPRDDRGGYQGNRGGPRDDRGGPRNDRGGSRDDRGGYRDNRGGPRNDRGGYQGNRGGPRDDRGGPRDDRGGYQGNRGGPRDDRGGPREDRGGPRNDRGGYQGNRGAPRDDRGGPRNDRGGYQGNRGGPRDDRGGPRNDRGPRDDRGGPRDGRGGYQGNRGAPRDDRGGPRDGRGGYQGNRGAPRDDRGGPRDDRGGDRDNRGGPRGRDRDDRGGPRGGDRDNRGGPRSGDRDNRGAPRNDRPAPRNDRPAPRSDRAAPRKERSGPSKVANPWRKPARKPADRPPRPPQSDGPDDQ